MHHSLTYLYRENDQVPPLEAQKMMVERTRQLGVEVAEESCKVGHSPYLNTPKVVLDVVRKTCGWWKV